MDKHRRIISWTLNNGVITRINPAAVQEPLQGLVRLVQRRWKPGLEITLQWLSVITESERERFPREVIESLFQPHELDDSAAQELTKELHVSGAKVELQRLAQLEEAMPPSEFRKKLSDINKALQTDIFKDIDDSVELLSGFSFEAIYNPDTKKVPSPFNFMNNVGVEFKTGQSVAFAAAPGNGKSLIMHLIAMHAVKQGKNVFFTVLEELKDEFMLRHAAILFDIPVPNPKNQEEQLNVVGRLNEMSAELDRSEWGRFDIAYYLQRPTIKEIETKMLQQEKELGITYDMLVIDYSGIVAGEDQSLAEWQQNQEVLENIKKLARAKNKVVITAIQPNNEGMRREIALSTMSKSQAGPREMDYVFSLERGEEGEYIGDDLIPTRATAYKLKVLKARTSYVTEEMKHELLITPHLQFIGDAPFADQ